MVLKSRCPTWDLGLERAAHDVLGSSILDRDQIVSGSHGCVGDLVALGTLLTVHFHFWRPVDGHRKSSRASIAGVHDKLWCHTWRRWTGWTPVKMYFLFPLKALKIRCLYTCCSSLQSCSKGRNHSRISHLSWFTHSDLKGAARNMAPIEANMDGMNAVLSRDKSDSILIWRNTKTTEHVKWKRDGIYLVYWTVARETNNWRVKLFSEGAFVFVGFLFCKTESIL